MIQPTTQFTVVLLLALSALCWGSWASTFKLTKNWRFEHFYYDFTAGLFLTSLVAAFTLGSVNAQDLTFQDNFLLASYRKIAWVLGSGLVFNLGNMFLLAATAVSGMTVAFPIALGIALVVGAIFDFTYGPEASLLLVFGGIVLVTTGMVANLVAYSWRQDSVAPSKPPADPRSRKAPRREANLARRGVILAVASGLLLSAFFPMLAEGTAGETGVSPYGGALLISISVLASTLLFVPFFLFFPVLGEPGQVRGYLSGDRRQHTLGVLGGVLWGAGILTNLLASAAPQGMQPGRFAKYALDHAALVVAAAWGLLVWREFKGSSYRVRMVLTAMIVLLVAGVGLVAVAPTYGK